MNEEAFCLDTELFTTPVRKSGGNLNGQVYQTTDNIYTHLKDETIQMAHVNLEKVFSGEEPEE